MLLSSNHSPTFLGLNTVSRVLSMGWVPCRGDRYYSHPGVAKATQVKHMVTMRLFWPGHWTQTNGTRVRHLKDGIGPFLSIAHIQHSFSQ
ncbi:hypothetical protein TNIN_2181 [Trichonephila inaurata madagascariensis]|uniref:Uncharacterized protein n=1 Tax=Trichonephila inaurata madagascariensis TaxID=2747483 RepID=A0A8X6JNP3_9ARAC|nr:hypothetical protein TNIN_139101 [Trichonephila inaurata madagascariensis]GFY37272.1 hypothetical protein TNIN_2181 [Trichonephila inaurata madagascariensis]